MVCPNSVRVGLQHCDYIRIGHIMRIMWAYLYVYYGDSIKSERNVRV